MSAEKSIPARPSLEQYRKQAKDLVKERGRFLPRALERIRRHHPRLRALDDAGLRQAAFTLSDAQLVLAREHDFKSWPEFARHVGGARSADVADRYLARIDVGGVQLDAEVAGWRHAKALVLLVQADGAGVGVASTQHVAEELNRASFCTIACDLLTKAEALAHSRWETSPHDIRLFAGRIGTLTDWIAHQPSLQALRIGCFGSGTGSAAVLLAAAERSNTIRAIVSTAGRPDLAMPWLGRVGAPTLSIAGTRDSTVVLASVGSVRHALPRQSGSSLELIEGTGHALTNGPFLEEVARRSSRWFRQYLVSGGQQP